LSLYEYSLIVLTGTFDSRRGKTSNRKERESVEKVGETKKKKDAIFFFKTFFSSIRRFVEKDDFELLYF